MTRCVATKSYDDDGKLSLYLTAFGHADYAENGKDIVCSAVSCLCMSLTQTLVELGVSSECFRIKDGSFYMSAIVEKDHQYAEGAFDVAVIGLGMIAEEYPDHVFLGSGVSH